MRLSSSPRLGCVQYLNARPLIHGWPGPVVFDQPANLARRLAEGELDIAFVSAAEFLRDPRYLIVRGISVGSPGPVYSVVVAHEAPLSRLTEISPDPASLTSNALLRVLCAERGIALSKSVHDLPRGSFGKLLIGDQGLRFRIQHGDKFSYWDLASAWRELTGLPFVFALWLVRAETPNATEMAEKLRALRDRNLSNPEPIIDAASPIYSPEFCRQYFSEYLDFNLNSQAVAGLSEFHRRGLRVGLDFARDVSFQFI